MITPTMQKVLNAAVKWAEVHYLRKDMDTSEQEFCEAVNKYLETPEAQDITEI